MDRADLRAWAAECRAYASTCPNRERSAVTELAEAFEAMADTLDAETAAAPAPRQ